MSTIVSPPPTRAVHTYATAASWLETWSDLREQGWETVLLDAHQGVEALLMGPPGRDRDAHRSPLVSLRLAAEPAPQRPASPSGLDILETLDAEMRIAGEEPDLGWQAPTSVPVRGKGLFVYPLGPARADVAESLLYRLVVMGDEIVQLDLSPHFKRRHIRQLVRGRSLLDALPIIARFTTTSNVHHTLALAMAAEAAWDVPAHPDAAATRVLLAELERAVSHLGDLAALAASTGLTVPQMEYLHLKETLLRVNFALFGHRYLRGMVCPGGLNASALPVDADPVPAAESVRDILRSASAIAGQLAHTPSFLDRLYGAGVVPPSAIRQLRPVGPVGRASGLALDVRQRLSYADYPPDLRVPVLSRADAYARFRVRVDELEQSLDLVLSRLSAWDPARLSHLAVDARAFSGPPRSAQGVGVVEAPRGLLAYRLVLDADSGRLDHLGVATPSARNWPVVPVAVANGNILQDFPIIDASFGLSVAGWDS